MKLSKLKYLLIVMSAGLIIKNADPNQLDWIKSLNSVINLQDVSAFYAEYRGYNGSTVAGAVSNFAVGPDPNRCSFFGDIEVSPYYDSDDVNNDPAADVNYVLLQRYLKFKENNALADKFNTPSGNRIIYTSYIRNQSLAQVANYPYDNIFHFKNIWFNAMYWVLALNSSFLIVGLKISFKGWLLTASEDIYDANFSPYAHTLQEGRSEKVF